jgi:hypothetical protein
VWFVILPKASYYSPVAQKTIDISTNYSNKGPTQHFLLTKSPDYKSGFGGSAFF